MAQKLIVGFGVRWRCTVRRILRKKKNKSRRELLRDVCVDAEEVEFSFRSTLFAISRNRSTIRAVHIIYFTKETVIRCGY